MKRVLWVSGAVLCALGLSLYAAQPPGDDRRPPDDGQGPGRRGGDRQMRTQRLGPPRWELGRILPPPLSQQLHLSDDQKRQLHDLESEVKERVMKILTDEQKAKINEFERRGPMGAPPGNMGGPADDERGGTPDSGRRGGRRVPGGAPPGGDRSGPPDQDRDRPPDDRDGPPGGPPPALSQARTVLPAAGIQWFATLESGLREARRSGRPILLVSAAPHCGGVPGVW